LEKGKEGNTLLLEVLPSIMEEFRAYTVVDSNTEENEVVRKRLALNKFRIKHVVQI
jgi:hypothetical protein